MTNLVLAPLMETETTIILNILGNMIERITIDKCGLMGTPKCKIDYQHYIGIIVIIISIILINIF